MNYYYMECLKCNRHWEVKVYQKTDYCKRCSVITYQKRIEKEGAQNE